jgi:hypothetical protein
MDNFILEIPNIVPPNLCKEIIKKFKNDPNKSNAPTLAYLIGNEKLIVDGKRSAIMMKNNKNYDEFIKPMIEIFFDIYDKYLKHLETTFKDINKDADYNMNPFIREIKSDRDVNIEGGFIVHEITKGRSYKWHHDFIYSDGERFISIIIYLNTLEEDEGGHTEFLCGRKVRPEIGKAVAYPVNWDFIHKGNEVLGDNAKYICTGQIKTIYHYEYIK